MQSQLTCPLCEENYQSDNLPRLLIGCGHTYCQKCLKKIMTEKKGAYKVVCPEDGEMFTFETSEINNFPKNLALIKIMDSKNNNLSFKDSSLEMSKINKNGSVDDDEDARDLMDAIGETSQPMHEEEKPEIEMCQIHHKPLEVVCILDLKKICANCAIFGEHKGHEFKSLDQIQQQRMEYYTSIINIMGKKQGITQRISNEETCNEIMGILENRKQKMKKSITGQYQKLKDAIEQKQNQSLKSLDSVIEKTQGKLKSLMKIEAGLMEKYMKWEDLSFEEIKILEGSDFEAKLQLLYACNQSVDVIEEGENIIVDMVKHEENLFQEAELVLQNIGVDFNNEIFQYIEGFVEIFDEIKKKKPKTRASREPTASKPIVKKQIAPQSKVIEQQKRVIIEKNILEEKAEIATQPTKIQEEDQQDLLVYDQPVTKKPEFIKKEEEKLQKEEKPSQQIKEIHMSPPVSEEIKQSKISKSSRDNSFNHEKIERPSKKKLSKIRLPEKFEKVADALANDTLELVDFTNAELGDSTIAIIAEFLNGSKAKTVKFIRNKINDETIAKILPYMGSVITLNLSQNFLTDRVLDILIDGRHHMTAMKSIILSQNKIIERKHKIRIEKLRSLDLTVSV